MIRAYARVSTADQNLDLQLDALKNYGIDIMYCKEMSGVSASTIYRVING